MTDREAARSEPSGRTLVWDLGGVVLRWEPVELVREALGLPDTDFALFGNFVPGGFWEAFDRGELGLDETAAHMAAASGLPVEETRRVLDAVPDHLALRLDTVALIERVRSAGHRTVYLSNMPAVYVPGLEPMLAPLFSGGVFSGCVGQVKPGREIFDTALRQLDLDPQRLLFLDDREPNVDAARAAGWPAARFEDAASCERDLVAAGWL